MPTSNLNTQLVLEGVSSATILVIVTRKTCLVLQIILCSRRSARGQTAQGRHGEGAGHDAAAGREHRAGVQAEHQGREVSGKHLPSPSRITQAAAIICSMLE